MVVKKERKESKTLQTRQGWAVITVMAHGPTCSWWVHGSCESRSTHQNLNWSVNKKVPQRTHCLYGSSQHDGSRDWRKGGNIWHHLIEQTISGRWVSRVGGGRMELSSSNAEAFKFGLSFGYNGSTALALPFLLSIDRGSLPLSGIDLTSLSRTHWSSLWCLFCKQCRSQRRNG